MEVCRIEVLVGTETFSKVGGKTEILWSQEISSMVDGKMLLPLKILAGQCYKR